MALDFATTARIDHGAPASLDTIWNDPRGAYVWAWVYRDTTGAGAILVKDNAAGAEVDQNGWIFTVDSFPAEGSLRFAVFRGSIPDDFSDRKSSGTVVALNDWTFCYGDFRQDRSQTIRLFTGDLGTRPEETAYSAFSSEGTGTINSDGAYALTVGNQERGGYASPMCGRIGRYGIGYGIPKYADIVRLWRTSAPLDDQVLLHVEARGTAPQIDLTRYRHHGTVTGATPIAAPPLPRMTRLAPAARIAKASASSASPHIHVNNMMLT